MRLASSAPDYNEEQVMHRRGFLRASGSSMVGFAPWPWVFNRHKAPAPPAKGVTLMGKPEPFSYANLKGVARSMGAAPYGESYKPLPPGIQHLTWDQWESITYRPDRALWYGEDLLFRIRFDHLGFSITKPVQMYAVENGQAREILFDPTMFDYSKSGLKPADLPRDLGFSGFNVLFHTDWTSDRAVFQGASYFRAVDGDMQYGMSQRGLAVNCGLPQPEEFPDFVAYYLERPAKESSRLTVYGLLDSPSIAGAYRFVIDVDDTMVMDIDSALYPRRTIERLGIAPATSMFLCAKNDRRVADDWRPEIHDSDGLQLCTGVGEWIWRPLVNPAALRVNSYMDDSPRGFGLMQRERRFIEYQDDGAFYDKRPDVWIEPKTPWRRGAVMLVEIPTLDETQDNIVAFWTPEDKPQPGVELLYGYRLYWCRENPHGPQLALVRATRSGIGGVVGQKRSHFAWRFVVDFGGGDLGALAEHAQLTPVITASRGRIELTSARRLVPLSEWRVMFDLALTDDSTEPINLRLFLSLDGQALSETWLYQYSPPPPAQRKL
jgi:periplasmic glucans biosynthesis protein